MGLFFSGCNRLTSSPIAANYNRTHLTRLTQLSDPTLGKIAGKWNNWSECCNNQFFIWFPYRFHRQLKCWCAQLILPRSFCLQSWVCERSSRLQFGLAHLSNHVKLEAVVFGAWPNGTSLRFLDSVGFRCTPWHKSDCTVDFTAEFVYDKQTTSESVHVSVGMKEQPDAIQSDGYWYWLYACKWWKAV